MLRKQNSRFFRQHEMVFLKVSKLFFNQHRLNGKKRASTYIVAILKPIHIIHWCLQLKLPLVAVKHFHLPIRMLSVIPTPFQSILTLIFLPKSVEKIVKSLADSKKFKLEKAIEGILEGLPC